MSRREFRDLADPADVREALATLDLSAGDESVPLESARERVLAERVEAPIDVPGFDRAAMDGYALRAADTADASEADPVHLSVVGTVHAGEAPIPGSSGPETGWTLGPGDAVEIATGAAMPPGADAVVPAERTETRGREVAVRVTVSPGDSVMPRGADVASGDRALGPGTRLGPRHVGLLAALGLETVPVTRRPRVAVVATGDELVQPGERLDPDAGQIYDVNSHSIAAAVRAAGGESRRYVPPSDDPAELRNTLAEAAEDCELLLTAGATSVGSVDVLPDIVAEHGEVLVHGVALKPGKPVLVGRAFGTPYVGLPGYPVSALTIFRTFVAGPLRAAAGQPEPTEASVTATLGTDVPYDGDRLRLVPVGLVDDGADSFVAYARLHGSGATTSLVEADGVVRMAPDTDLLPAGRTVTVERFDVDDPLPSLLGVGEPDPVVSRLLDDLESPRFLSLGPREAREWLDDGVPDVAVVATDGRGDRGRHRNADPLAAVDREWGLILPTDDPHEIEGVEDLGEADLRFANLAENLALRRAFDAWLSARGVDDPTAVLPGGRVDLPGLESAARSVAAGRSDAGLGLRATADSLGLGFVPLDRQRLALVTNPDRREKASVDRLAGVLEERLPALLSNTPGYEPVED